MAEVTFFLTSKEREILNQEINGSGGFQTLGRALQVQMKPNGELTVDDEQLGSIIRCMGYTQGGFQNRFKGIFGRSINNALK